MLFLLLLQQLLKHQQAGKHEVIEEIYGGLNGILGIRNEIAIQPAAPLGDVRASIDDALKRNVLVDASHIKTHVSHGVVSLRGAARCRAERDEAMHAAWSAPGVSKVEDHITIGLA